MMASFLAASRLVTIATVILDAAGSAIRQTQ